MQISYWTKRWSRICVNSLKGHVADSSQVISFIFYIGLKKFSWFTDILSININYMAHLTARTEMRWINPSWLHIFSIIFQKPSHHLTEASSNHSKLILSSLTKHLPRDCCLSRVASRLTTCLVAEQEHVHISTYCWEKVSGQVGTCICPLDSRH